MNQKTVGIFLIIISILLAGLFYKIKYDSEQQIELLREKAGEQACFLGDGTCLHDRQNNMFIFEEGLAVFLFSLGLYLLFFDTTRETKELVAKQSEQNVQIANALKQSVEEKKKDERFTAFLAGFSDGEKKLLAAIHEQDGILQSTLRYRTGLTKTDVSLLLKKFEEKGYVSKKPEGNTNKVFLKKIF
ncbi:MarR family transcriptional regulator [Candidatus Woesearchaeota archaeon]|nr:MarR family transcriptional regulator [Candidatus Woesearchaeota archaeon]